MCHILQLFHQKQYKFEYNLGLQQFCMNEKQKHNEQRISKVEIPSWILSRDFYHIHPVQLSTIFDATHKMSHINFVSQNLANMPWMRANSEYLFQVNQI